MDIQADSSREAVNEVVRLHREVYEAEYALEPTFANEVATHLAEWSRAGGSSEREGLWLARLDERVVGSIMLFEEDEALGRLGYLVLAHEARGTGAGRSLVETVLEAARAAGYARLHLFTFSDLSAAGSLYRSVGFEATSTEDTVRWGRRMQWQRYELAL